MLGKAKRILVPRWMDAENFNPQNSNAQNIISRWSNVNADVTAFYYKNPRLDVAANSFVHLYKLWRRRFWKISVWRAYQEKLDAIFYPGADISDDLGWRFRDFTGRTIPIIATLEGLAGNPEREREYSDWAGHQVYCQHLDNKTLTRLDRLYHRADHVIAISPFLAEMGSRRYGNKFSIIPLGIDSSIFFTGGVEKSERITVIGAGRLYENKRPELFIELASRHHDADFVWYGWGDMAADLKNEVQRMGLTNLVFPGPVSPNELANAMRKAHLFALPSKSEGVPKVTQEAAACGLPVVLFGFYEAPSVIDGENGFVVWDDAEFYDRIGQLIASNERCKSMGECGASMAKEFSWDTVAHGWEQHVQEIVNQATGSSNSFDFNI